MRASARDSIGSLRGKLAHDIVFAWELGLSRPRDKLGIGRLRSILDNDSSGVPYFPDVQSQRAGVDIRDRSDSVLFEVFMNGADRTAMTRSVRVLAHDHPRDPWMSGFVSRRVNPIVPNEGICHADD